MKELDEGTAKRSGVQKVEHSAENTVICYEDVAYEDNDGNGHYYVWVGLEKTYLVDLFRDYLGVNLLEKVPVIITALDGEINIRRKRKDGS